MQQKEKEKEKRKRKRGARLERPFHAAVPHLKSMRKASIRALDPLDR